MDFFDISGGTYESPAWRGNIMKELENRPSQQERGRFVGKVPLLSELLIDLPTALLCSYFIEWAQELKKVLVSLSNFGGVSAGAY